MCIAILIPAQKTITRKTLKNCWDSNTHGAGMAYPDGEGGMVIEKELISFKNFYSKFTKARKANPEAAFMLHFRIATHGGINADNCHPFLVNKGLAFCHNGIIYSMDDHTGQMSDTRVFNQRILQKMPEDFELNDDMCWMIGEAIGHNKLIFLRADNQWSIVNADLGVWDEGIWYSNLSYRDSYGSRYADPRQWKGANNAYVGKTYSPGSYGAAGTKALPAAKKEAYAPAFVGDDTDEYAEYRRTDGYVDWEAYYGDARKECEWCNTLVTHVDDTWGACKACLESAGM